MIADNTGERMKRYQLAPLFSGIVQTLECCGVSPIHAEVLAKCLVSADVFGVHTHGLTVFPSYISRITGGGFAIDAEPKIEKQTVAFAVVNACNTLGPVSGKFCMELAMEQCTKSGIFTVFAHNANTFGPAFYYSKLASDRNLIGISFSNSPSAMPAWGGKQKILGTNPLSVSVPGNVHGPILLDMATSVVAKSKINEYRKLGKELPVGWAVDSHGNPTTDPQTAIDGMILPMAEHKGYALAMVLDLLSGLLSGSGYLNHVGRFYSSDNSCMNVGHCFIAIDPVQIHSVAFFEEVDQYIDELHASGESVQFPGERRLQYAKTSQEHGVALHDETIVRLLSLFEQYKIEKALVTL